MKLFIICITAFCLFPVSSCDNSANNKTEVLTDKKLFSLDPDNTEESIDLRLTDLADSLRFIVLETTEGSLLRNSFFYMSEKYILANSQGDYYKFSADGKFIKKIMETGRGPKEISIITSPYLDKERNLLYLNDHQKNSLIVYDLVTDQFQRPIEKGNMGFGYEILDDSLIISAGAGTDALVIQNFKGDVLNRLPNHKRVSSGVNREGRLQGVSLYHFQNDYYIKSEKDDTLFILKENSLIPYLVVNFNVVRENPPAEIIKNGDRSFSVISITEKSVLISTSAVENIEYYSGGNVSYNRKRAYFLLDKATGRSVKIRSFTDDFSGSVQKASSEGIRLPANLTSGRIIIPLNPYEIREILTRGSQNPGLQKSVLDQLQKISNDQEETDNPVLIVGKIKI